MGYLLVYDKYKWYSKSSEHIGKYVEVEKDIKSVKSRIKQLEKDNEWDTVKTFVSEVYKIEEKLDLDELRKGSGK